MSDLVRRLRRHIPRPITGAIGDLHEAADRIEELESKTYPTVQDVEGALKYAERLACGICEEHYPEVTQWKPLSGDLIGLLTQIDNMVSGRSHHPTGQEIAAAYRSPLVWYREDSGLNVHLTANTPFFAYFVSLYRNKHASSNEEVVVLSVTTGDSDCDVLTRTKLASLDEGVSLAQADYDKRISQILETLVRK